MTTEELQKTWQESGRIGSPYNPRMNSRRETALEKLAREYRRFSMVALVMTIVSLGLYNFPWLEMPWKVVIPVLFISFSPRRRPWTTGWPTAYDPSTARACRYAR